MVAAEDGDSMGVADFEGNEESDRFDGVVATIDVVSCDRCQDAAFEGVRECIPMNR